jgi:hypothetical protein
MLNINIPSTEARVRVKLTTSTFIFVIYCLGIQNTTRKVIMALKTSSIPLSLKTIKNAKL